MFSHSSFTGLVGVARTDITPPVGIYCRNWGAAARDTAQGIHRPLYLTVIAIRTTANQQPLVLIDADLGGWSGLNFVRRFLHRLAEAVALPREQIMFCVTHSHSTPFLCNPDSEWEGGVLLAEYIETIFQSTVETIQRAVTACEPATIEWHHGRCELAANRDLSDPGPRERIVCGFNPEKLADDKLVVGRITGLRGRLLATITNYACHPTTLAWECDRVSPDFVGEVRTTIEHVTNQAPAVFLQGASGDLAPRYQYVGDPAIADAHGRQLGHASIAALLAMEPPGQELVYDRVVESGAPLAVWRRQAKQQNLLTTSLVARSRTVDIPLKNWPTTAELASQFAANLDRALAERLRRKLRIRESIGDGSKFSLEIWGWRIGETLVLGTMAESYSSLQVNVRAAFPDREVVWLNLVNGGIGYLPPASSYDRDIYQVWQTPFDRGSLELLEQAAIELGHDLLAIIPSAVSR